MSSEMYTPKSENQIPWGKAPEYETNSLRSLIPRQSLGVPACRQAGLTPFVSSPRWCKYDYVTITSLSVRRKIIKGRWLMTYTKEIIYAILHSQKRN